MVVLSLTNEGLGLWVDTVDLISVRKIAVSSDRVIIRRRTMLVQNCELGQGRVSTLIHRAHIARLPGCHVRLTVRSERNLSSQRLVLA